MLINVVYKRIESKQTGIGGCRMNVENMIIMILVAVVCTFFWRVLPFALLGGEKNFPKRFVILEEFCRLQLWLC